MLNIDIKIKIIKQIASRELVTNLVAEFGVGIKRVHDIIKYKDKLLQFAPNSDSFNGLKKGEKTSFFFFLKKGR